MRFRSFIFALLHHVSWCFFLFYPLIITGQDIHNDSLDYTARRTEIMALDSLKFKKYIEAADQLADLQLYSRALSVINGLVGQETTKRKDKYAKDSVQAAESEKYIFYKIRIGGDYLKFNDPQTSNNKAEIIDPHTLDDKRVYSTFTMHIIPPQLAPVSFTPEIKVSNQQAGLSLRNVALFFDSLFLFEIEYGVRKQFWQEEYDTVVTTKGDHAISIAERDFSALKELPSDMFTVSVGLEFTNRYRGVSFTYNVPVRVNLKKYRENYSPYVSFIDYQMMPGIEYSSHDFSKTVRFQLECDFKDYNGINLIEGVIKDTADKIMIRPDFTFTAYSNTITNELAASYCFENYIDAEYPKNWNQLILSSNHKMKGTASIQGNVNITYLYEHSLRERIISDSTVVEIKTNPFTLQPDTVWNKFQLRKEYTVYGNSITIAPEIVFEPKEWLKTGCCISYKETWYPVSDVAETDYIVESVRSFIPELWCSIDKNRVNIVSRLAWQHTVSKKSELYDYDNKESYRFSIDGNTVVFKWLSLFAVADFEISKYDNQSKPQNNISLSGGSTIQF